MGPYLIVFAGAGLGGMARHAVNMAGARLGYAFPWATISVNVAGSILMGVLAGWFALKTGAPQHVKLFLTTGVLGGFTTFSAFSFDMFAMIERGQWAGAAAYALVSVIGALALFALGFWLMRLAG